MTKDEVRELFERCLQAVKDSESISNRLLQLHQLGKSSGMPKASGSSGFSDPTADSGTQLADVEDTLLEERDRLREVIEDCRLMCRGARSGVGHRDAAIVEDLYINGHTWRQTMVLNAVSSTSLLKRHRDRVFQWIADVGPARAKSW